MVKDWLLTIDKQFQKLYWIINITVFFYDRVSTFFERVPKNALKIV